MASHTIHPSDVAVALDLAAIQAQHDSLPLPLPMGYRNIALRVGISHGEAHNAVKRLRVARLVRPDSLDVEASSLVEFVLHGVRYAFPAELGFVARGVATGPSAPVVAASFDSDMEPIVWSSPGGAARGASIAPLVPRATDLPTANPALYELLALVDALRIGQPRDRRFAGELLYQRIGMVAAPAAKHPVTAPFIGRRRAQ